MRLALAAAFLLATAPCFALDAVTYRGTLGDHQIVVELTAPDFGTLVGRYSYMDKGGDIPLDALENADGSMRLAEEAPCDETNCIADDDGVVADKPVAAVWTLTPAPDSRLVGTWRVAGKASKQLEISLTEIGRRTLPEHTEISPDGLWSSADNMTYGDPAGFTASGGPYETAKMDVTLDEGPVETLEGSSFRYVTDPRSKFAFPRIVALADGSSPDAANAALAARHAMINTYAFDCLSRVYAGFGANSDMLGMGAGTLADYDYENVTMIYLSPTVMNWTEGGSNFCQGAYPNHHFDSYIVDVPTGAPFALGKVFKDWTATVNYLTYDAPQDQAIALETPELYRWEAGQELIDYVIANRTPSDATRDDDCGINDLIATNLGMRFAPGDQVIFSLDHLAHVIFACGEDLLTVKLADIPTLLTPEAKDYFPSLVK